MIKVPKRIDSVFVLGFLLSLFIVALGQPARVGWLGAIAATLGFTLFFCALPQKLSRLNRFILSVIWFTAIQLIQLSWMTSIEYQGYYVLVVYAFLSLAIACQFGFLTILIPTSGKIPLNKLLFCAALWTLMEWSRLFFLCGFSWNPIGLSLTYFISSLQFTSLFGVFGMSFWVMLTNLWGVNVWRSRFQGQQTMCWVALIILPYLFGALHLNYHAAESPVDSNDLNIALMQTSLLPTEKIPHSERMEDFISPFEQWRRILASLNEKRTPKWDLIVLPEAVVPLLSDLSFYHYEMIRELFIAQFGYDIIFKFPPLMYPFAQLRDISEQKIWCVSNLFLCQTLANHYQAEIVAGLDYSDLEGKKNFNSAFYLKPNSISYERYDKQKLLPVAEYLPFDFLRPLAKWYGILDFFAHGKGAKVFGQKVPFSVAICYEETFPEIIREGRSKGAQLFINISNDNYYPKTSLHEQHFYHARLRAVENGAPLIRACNSGVTAAIDSFGKVLGRFDERSTSSATQEGVLACRVKTYQYSTPFSFWGEAGIVSLSLMILFLFLRLRSRPKT